MENKNRIVETYKSYLYVILITSSIALLVDILTGNFPSFFKALFDSQVIWEGVMLDG